MRERRAQGSGVSGQGLWFRGQKRKNKKTIFSLIFVFFFLSPIPCPLSPVFCFAQEKIVAVVNNEIITQKDLDDFANFMRLELSSEYGGKELESKIASLEPDLLDKLIDDRLMLLEAKKNNLKIDQNRVKAKINEIKKHYSSDAEFQDALIKQGLVQADLESRITEQMLMYSIIESQIKNKIAIRPSEVTDFYYKNIDEFKIPQLWEFESVALENKDLAFEFFDSLNNTASFDDLVKKYSLNIDKLRMAKGQLKKEVEDIVFKLKLQEVSTPIPIGEKYYIFRLVKTVPAHKESLCESEPNIYSFLYNKKMQEQMQKRLSELKRKTYIKIMK